ncbi:MAG: D-alanine--D-alanine ligase [Planctomycetota bacterium]|nr:D-alanine--D-alanine ligase [Planctomycetota bacterium]
MLFHTYDSAPAETELYDIAVLAGGDSAERQISVASGHRVAGALEEFGHQVAVFDPEDADLFGINWNEFDACFIALHGGAGEDGRIQVQLEELCVPYTGSGPVTSRLALSKSATKDRLHRCGVSTPPHFSFHKTDSLPKILARVRRLGFPLIVKPDGQGCSLGVTVADDADSLAESIEAAGRFESYLLAEQTITGREFTVAVIDRQPLPALEIIHPCRTFDYDLKYGAEAVRHEFPDDEAASTAQQTAVAAADALGTRGLVRVDLITDREGQAWVLEVNTIPGMTTHSLAPLAAAQAELSMPQFCDRLVRLCLPQAIVV